MAATGLYRYNSLYRLIAAQGREHPGQQQPTGTFDITPANIPHANDLQALVQYIESYSYDQVGNIQAIQHRPIFTGANWTRNYQYDTASNRLLSNNDPDAGGGTATYGYTGNGAMNKMAHLQAIDWDYADRIHHANLLGGGDVFFTYDGSGQRVRKVLQPTTSTTLTERIYVGGWETFRSRAGGTITSPVTTELQTLHVMDDQRRIAMVERTTTGGTAGTSGPLWRFQLSNLLDSAVMEIDAQGRVITYEEYHPYGSTAFRSSDGSSEVSPKRYRYTGKERDEETGLYYHGARYYAPWLGRWTAADPTGFVDGPNVFAYGRNNPIRLSDPTGHQSSDDEPSTLGRVFGGLKAVGGALETFAGGTLIAAGVATSEFGIGIPIAIAGGLVTAHGIDTAQAGVRQAIFGVQTDTVTSTGLQKAGLTRTQANLVDAGIGVVGTLGASAVTKAPALAAAGTEAVAATGTEAAATGAKTIADVGAKTAPKAAGTLAHLTNPKAAAAIKAAQTLGKGGTIYAGPASIAKASPLGLALKTGLRASQATETIVIPAEAAGAFRVPAVVGPLTAIQRGAGTVYSAGAGSINLATGAFTRAGVATNQIAVYGVDATINFLARTGPDIANAIVTSSTNATSSTSSRAEPNMSIAPLMRTADSSPTAAEIQAQKSLPPDRR